jgi:CRISPR-associated protein Cmr1
MTNAEDERTYQLKALTDLWTGSVTLEEKTKPNRLITTGLLGSIRWWFEVLVRGLGGSACDPTGHTKCEGRNHCVACEIFGCTGWARKFKFQVLNEKGDVEVDQIKQNTTFSLRFIPLRPIRGEEWALLDATLRLIAEYGAIGGKTVFKPTDEPGRASAPHHKDYGLVRMDTSQQFVGTSRDDLRKYLSKWRKLNHGEFAWVSLQNFWCVNGKYLTRKDNNTSTFNRVLGRLEPKNRGQQLVTDNAAIAKWLAGIQPESKKVFSFKGHVESKKIFSFKCQARTYGFVKPGLIDFNTMKQRLSNAWGPNGWDFLAGDKIINLLFAGEGDHS